MSEMTNREKAKQILGYRIDIAGNQTVKDQPLIEAIEKALDQAEQRGMKAGRKERKVFESEVAKLMDQRLAIIMDLREKRDVLMQAASTIVDSIKYSEDINHGNLSPKISDLRKAVARATDA